MHLDRDLLARFFREGYWRHPLYAYRLWRAQSHRWASPRSVWEYIGHDARLAYLMMDGAASEEDLQATGRRAAEALRRGLAIGPAQRVLEVGCGVARIGRELASGCGEWWGGDISGSILRLAGKRTAHLPNVRLQTLDGSSLAGLPSGYFDRVYSHVVFMHLDQEDIFRYVCEMGRVLAPGGLIFYDGINLAGAEGWQRFEWEMAHYRPGQARPVHHSRFATPQEMRLYAEHAGLAVLQVLEAGLWVQIIATRLPADSTPEERERLAAQAAAQIDGGALAGIS